MSYGETITRTDLTNILNEVLPISYSLSSVQTVTLPFTPTSNGLLIGLIRAKSQGRAYVTFNNVTPTFFDGYQAADGYFIGVGFVEKGKQISTTSAVSNVKQQLYYFVSLGNDSLADYIVEQGTSGIWTYRKWNSGVAECWGLHSKTISGVSGSTPFSGYCFAFGSISFPTSFFNATPVVSVAGQVASNYMCVCYNSASSTGVNVELQSNVSGSRTCVVHIYAIGKWK